MCQRVRNPTGVRAWREAREEEDRTCLSAFPVAYALLPRLGPEELDGPPYTRWFDVAPNIERCDSTQHLT